MTNVMGKIMAEVLCLLAIATKEMKQKRTSAFISGTELPLTYIRTETFFKKLIGRNEIEDALQKLDKLEQGELRTVTSQVLKTTCDIRDVANELKGAQGRYQ
jgi:TATA-binding protein-associated factor Taf7